MLSIGTSFGDSVSNGNNAKNMSPIMEEINLSKHYKGDIIMKKVIAAMIGIDKKSVPFFFSRNFLIVLRRKLLQQ